MKRGFSLVEALVVLAILTVGLLAIAGLQRQLVDGQRRYEAALARSQMRRNALDALRDLNFADQPEGRLTLPPARALHWTTTPLAPFTPSASGAWLVRVYAVRVDVEDGERRVLDTIRLDRLGWRPRPPGSPGSPGLAVPAPGRP